MTTVNLNADIGESYGVFHIGNDEEMIRFVQSASIACGFHAGDPTTMAQTARAAKDQGVSVGAHPSFDDLWGFGRREIRMNTRDVEYLVAYQIGALSAIATAVGTAVTHVKPHGALSNMAERDAEYAAAIARAIKSVDRDLIFVAIACSEMVKAGHKEGLRVADEAFCDRTYDESGKITSRRCADAVIRDPQVAVQQVLSFISEGAIITRTGKRISTPIRTFCTHGDEPTGVEVVRAVRESLAKQGIGVAPLPQLVF
jgi:UPF0271 protein